MSPDDLAALVLQEFTLPLADLGFELVGDPLGTSAFIAGRIGDATAYQLRAASNEIAATTERTRGGRLLFPEPKRAIDTIRSHPPVDPRDRPARSIAPWLNRSGEPPFVAAARKFVADCDADPARKAGSERVTPGRYATCLEIIDRADAGEFRDGDGAPTPDADRAAVLQRVLGGLRLGGRAVGIPSGDGAETGQKRAQDVRDEPRG